MFFGRLQWGRCKNKSFTTGDTEEHRGDLLRVNLLGRRSVERLSYWRELGWRALTRREKTCANGSR